MFSHSGPPRRVHPTILNGVFVLLLTSLRFSGFVMSLINLMISSSGESRERERDGVSGSILQSTKGLKHNSTPAF